MHAPLTPHENARLRELALKRAAQLRGEALRGIWSAGGRWASQLQLRGAAGGGARGLRLG